MGSRSAQGRHLTYMWSHIGEEIRGCFSDEAMLTNRRGQMSQVERHGWECFKQRESMENGTLEVLGVFQHGWTWRIERELDSTRLDRV